MELFPWRILRPKSQKTTPTRAVRVGPVSISSVQQTLAFDGGPLWRCAIEDVVLNTRDKKMCARAWSAYLQGGAREVIVPMFDVALTPWPVGTSYPACVTDGDFFGQTADFGVKRVTASIAASATLRATIVQITIEPSVNSTGEDLLREDGSALLREDGSNFLRENRGSAFRGGEHFSVQHDVSGWRLYRITRVTAISGNTHTVEIQPPLREAVNAGVVAEFDVPRCVMKLSPNFDVEPINNQTPLSPSVSFDFVESL